MNAVKAVLQHTIPQYLETLPLPDKVSGFAELTVDEWISLGPLITFALLVLTLVAQGFTSSAPKDSEWVNKSLKKDVSKVVNKVDIEDIAAKKKENVAFCRCYKSKAFPFCDGSHAAHNKATGDNAGPLVVCCKSEKQAK